ncbi:hypothetical protein D4764_15G0007330 [Takifugu flavidus]|uniref:Uncharacterized protein n=1 Tax=Takifugu flavidus TaxID=433684 RepID=A0A5C6P357_9TELE|nr:hypothetical protein D4764_15G0007330 [Takifugu flavidus]
MVVEVTAESGEAGKVRDLTGVEIEVLCGLGESGDGMSEISKLGEAGEMRDMGQTGEQGVAIGEVGQGTGERGVPAMVAGELGEGGMSTGEVDVSTDNSDQEYMSDTSELSNTVADSERDDLYPPGTIKTFLTETKVNNWIIHRAASDLTDPEIFRLKKHMGKARKQLRELSNKSTSFQIITKSGYEYQFQSGTTVSHLLYMDDIKLYAKNERDIDSLIHLTRIYSKDIGMSFGLDKCGWMVSRRGKANGNHEEAARRSATAKYLQRLRQVLKSQLNGKHKIQTINTYTLPVIRYPAGIIPWPLEEIQATDIKTRKLLTMHGGFHPNSSVLRLYTKRKEGGRGLVNVQTIVQEETTSLQEYIKKMAPTDPLLSESLRQQKPTKEEEPEGLSWKDKPMHGMYHRQIEEVADIEKTYQWLTKPRLKNST